MTGLDEFEKLFGGITVMNLIELLLAVVFLALVYKKVKDYLVKRYEAAKLKDEQLKTALDAVSQYPKYREQSIRIQQELESKIGELKRSQDENTARLKAMEEIQKRQKRNELRDRLLQSYRYYTDRRRNPSQVWNRMEAEAFWELFGDYEAADGDGYIHTVVQPAMNLLKIVEMDELTRTEEDPHHPGQLAPVISDGGEAE